ncbi:hypothetical protein, partial [Streptomyces sp. NEAU-YJ-81]|uniref:hypothetical protein n=1 Tax=Streptomyces sp. NEAU-YJ-81 TaxID=2820288 RepID=UPI001ABCAB76
AVGHDVTGRHGLANYRGRPRRPRDNPRTLLGDLRQAQPARCGPSDHDPAGPGRPHGAPGARRPGWWGHGLATRQDTP